MNSLFPFTSIENNEFLSIFSETDFSVSLTGSWKNVEIVPIRLIQIFPFSSVKHVKEKLRP
jgi:hypothetical protein